MQTTTVTENLIKADGVITDILYDVASIKAAANEIEQFQRVYRGALIKVLRSQHSRFEELDLTGDIEKLLDEASGILGSDVAEKLKPETEEYLRRAFVAGKSIQGIPRKIRTLFSEPHQAALDWMVKHDRFWIGKVFPSHLREPFKDAIVKGLEEGLGRKDIAGRLRQLTFGTPEIPGKAELYNRVASASVNRSRNWGSMFAMEEAKVETYQWRAVGDERTCARCSFLDTTEFRVDRMMKRVGLALRSEPKDIEWIAPWLNHDQANDDFYIRTKEGREYIKDKPASWLESRGVGLPPAHGGCRCTCTVS